MPTGEDGIWRPADNIKWKSHIRKTTGDRHTCSRCKKKRHRTFMHKTNRVNNWAMQEWECDDCDSDARTKRFKEKLEDNVQHNLGGLNEKTESEDEEIVY